MQDRSNSNQALARSSRCQVEWTLLNVHCESFGSIFYGDLLLVCDRHYRLFEIQDRMMLLSGLVSTLDLCLESLPLRRDPDTLRHLKLQRAEKVRELATARQDLQATNDEFPRDRPSQQGSWRCRFMRSALRTVLSSRVFALARRPTPGWISVLGRLCP